MSFAVRVVPSSGSSAISTAGPFPVPTSSPIYNIGASSRSPSPITTTPWISSRFNCSRMAFTAAWSAAFSSPRPMRSAEAIAAASDTRANPRDSKRSLKSDFCDMGAIAFLSDVFDAQSNWGAHQYARLRQGCKRLLQCGLSSFVSYY